MALEIPLFMQPKVGEIDYTGAQMRSMFTALIPIPGVTSKNDCLVTQRAAGANMSTDVASGQCAIPGSTLVNQGTFLCRSTAAVNVTFGPAPGTGTRTDLVVARVYDDQADSSGQSAWTPFVVPGVVGAGLPSTAGMNVILLASVSVSAGQASILTAHITDRRQLNTMGDVPMWEVSGGNGMSIPPAPGSTPYTGWTVADSVGMASVVAATGSATVQQSGRYVATFGTRITAGGAAPGGTRQIYVAHTRAGAKIRQFTDEANSGVLSAALGCSGLLRCLPGDVVTAMLWQNASAGNLNIDDINKETVFAGTWVGP